jgi:hypothetical protein
VPGAAPEPGAANSAAAAAYSADRLDPVALPGADELPDEACGDVRVAGGAAGAGTLGCGRDGASPTGGGATTRLRRNGIGSSSGSRLTAAAGAADVEADRVVADCIVPDRTVPGAVPGAVIRGAGVASAAPARASGAVERRSGAPESGGAGRSREPLAAGCPAVLRRSGSAARPLLAAAGAPRPTEGPRPWREPNCGPGTDPVMAAVAGLATAEPGSADASGPLTVAGRIGSAGTNAAPSTPALRACSGVRRSANWSLIGSAEPAFPTPRPELAPESGRCVGKGSGPGADGCESAGVCAAAEPRAVSAAASSAAW